jgi:hypothetical protein
VLLFTEYGFAESAMGAERFASWRIARDTPDLVILVTEPEPVLLAIEAKMFDRPSRAELVGQLDRQEALLVPLVERLARWLKVPAVRLQRAALLPAPLRAAIESAEPLPVPVITWEQVRDEWADIGGYYHHILAVALERYATLAAPAANHQDDDILGQVLLDAARAGTLAHPWMGRQGGFHGKALRTDLETGGWRTTRYQVRKAELPGNPNWFPVASFVAAVAG